MTTALHRFESCVVVFNVVPTRPLCSLGGILDLAVPPKSVAEEFWCSRYTEDQSAELKSPNGCDKCGEFLPMFRISIELAEYLRLQVKPGSLLALVGTVTRSRMACWLSTP